MEKDTCKRFRLTYISAIEVGVTRVSFDWKIPLAKFLFRLPSSRCQIASSFILFFVDLHYLIALHLHLLGTLGSPHSDAKFYRHRPGQQFVDTISANGKKSNRLRRQCRANCSAEGRLARSSRRSCRKKYHKDWHEILPAKGGNTAALCFI